MPGTFNCPACGAPFEYPGNVDTVACPYCRNSVIVPDELRPKIPAQPSFPGKGALTPEQLDEIKRQLQAGKKIEAIKVYRAATLAGLKEAKDAVEAIDASDPGLRNHPPAATRSPDLSNSSASSRGSQIKARIIVILVGLFFFGIASIFPLVFFPLGVVAWQGGEYSAAIVAFAGAVIWAVVWGGIGGVIVFSKV